MKYRIIMIILAFSPLAGNAQIDLDQSPSDPEVFAPGVVSTQLYERDIAISPAGDEIIYTLGDYKQSRRCLVGMKKKGKKWGDPYVLNISGKYTDIEPFLSPDGNRLYFCSTRPIYGDTSRSDYNIWYSDRQGDNWGTPVALDSFINTKEGEYYPSVASSGNLYFTSIRDDGYGLEDIFLSRYEDGKHLPPVALDSMINSATYEFNAYVSPDERIIVFGSWGREDGLGGGDLYVSLKDYAGNWQKAVNMGPDVNSDKLDYCPFIDWPRNNFYFTSERINDSQAALKTVDDLKNYANGIYNGLGNIFRMSTGIPASR